MFLIHSLLWKRCYALFTWNILRNLAKFRLQDNVLCTALHSACWECWPVQWQFNWRYRISLTSDKKVTLTLESKNCDDYLHLTAKKRGKVYLSMCKVGIYPRNCQKYLEQLNIWRRIFYQLLKIIPVSTQNFMLSCTVKCFSEYSFGISYDAHAWHIIALLQFWKWELGGLVHFNILRLLNSKSDINALENIYNGSLEVFEKIEPTPLRLNPLYIKVQFKRLKFSFKDKRH